MKNKCLVIIPAYNEQDNIGDLIKNIKSLESDYLDILVVNDKSTDNTADICEREGVMVINLPCNLGIGGAVQTGYKYAYQHKYMFAIQVDGDGQHNPEDIIKVVSPLYNDEADIVIGSRYINNEGFQSTKLRRVGIRYFSKLLFVLLGQNVTDPTSGFRGCNYNVIRLFAERYPIDYPEPESIVTVKRNGYRLKEVPVIMKERKGGISSIRSFRSIYYMIKVSMAILFDMFRKHNHAKYKA